MIATVFSAQKNSFSAWLMGHFSSGDKCRHLTLSSHLMKPRYTWLKENLTKYFVSVSSNLCFRRCPSWRRSTWASRSTRSSLSARPILSSRRLCRCSRTKPSSRLNKKNVFCNWINCIFDRNYENCLNRANTCTISAGAFLGETPNRGLKWEETSSDNTQT